MKFVLIKEQAPERRVLLSPKQLLEIKKKYPQHQFLVESSPHRAFSDKEYTDLNLEVVATPQTLNADVYLGIKAIKLEKLQKNKTYFFFSHTTKMQSYNKEYLKGLYRKGITFYDYENLINLKNQRRLLAFGYKAGYIGAYQSLRAYGMKHQSFTLPCPTLFSNTKELITAVQKIKLPKNLPIVVTGTGNVGYGVQDFLEGIGFEKQNSSEFLISNTDPTSKKLRFVQLKKSDYLKSKTNKKFEETDFLKNPSNYNNTFTKYIHNVELFIAAHYFHKNMPSFFTKEDLSKPDFKINTIGDLSCDPIEGPLPTTLKTTTAKAPIFGYHKKTHQEDDFLKSDTIAVMAIDHLPSLLPRASSTFFGEKFTKEIFPKLANNREDLCLEAACVLKNGKFTDKYQYLLGFLGDIEQNHSD